MFCIEYKPIVQDANFPKSDIFGIIKGDKIQDSKIDST